MGRVQCAEYPISSHIITLKSKSNLKKKQILPAITLKKCIENSMEHMHTDVRV